MNDEAVVLLMAWAAAIFTGFAAALFIVEKLLP